MASINVNRIHARVMDRLSNITLGRSIIADDKENVCSASVQRRWPVKKDL